MFTLVAINIPEALVLAIYGNQSQKLILRFTSEANWRICWVPTRKTLRCIFFFKLFNKTRLGFSERKNQKKPGITTFCKWMWFQLKTRFSEMTVGIWRTIAVQPSFKEKVQSPYQKVLGFSLGHVYAVILLRPNGCSFWHVLKTFLAKCLLLMQSFCSIFWHNPWVSGTDLVL